MNTRVNVDVKLGVNKFFVDEGNPHIEIAENPSLQEYAKLEAACPAGLYRRDEKGAVRFDYAGCLECGTCRILCGKTIVKRWEYPNGTFGVEFRYG
ncbi:4Fe-4S dicluster domain-containing protein [Desulfobotulus sp. H1]|uniref:4Fe-4S dicluster domain-containing protein n=1 Tax=Desulfobotulus pelophilus TaxID=2823377 RepID=A0ABT3NAT9_9BACT|nr:4Fe-4S dicluster domain-containing protein [Desulfobotulus pelophilus]MCW7754578.1 4Fe-4S dicluster domain-containing protein [Desulfobotulus pelophilus]